jgi:hypothetical protein
MIASCLLRRSAWAGVGGFPDLRAAEDRIFMRALATAGHRQATAPEAIATWQLQPDLVRTFRRFRTYSRVNVSVGEQRHWHYGVARQYLAAVPFVLLAHPAAGVAGGAALGFGARVVRLESCGGGRGGRRGGRSTRAPPRCRGGGADLRSWPPSPAGWTRSGTAGAATTTAHRG